MTADLFRVLRLWLGRSGWLVAGIIVTVLSALAGVALLAFAGKLVAASVGGVESAALAAAWCWILPFITQTRWHSYLATTRAKCAR